MLKTTFAVLLALTLSAGAATPESNSLRQGSSSASVAMELPAPSRSESRPVDKVDSTWDDTADTSDEMNETLLEIDTDSNPDVHLETDLRNNVHSPLLENDQVEPAEPAPPREPFDESHDPMVDPMP